jgi:hypothetical protein
VQVRAVERSFLELGVFRGERRVLYPPGLTRRQIGQLDHRGIEDGLWCPIRLGASGQHHDDA